MLTRNATDLTEALPDIWMPETIPQFDSFANSMTMGDPNLKYYSLDNTVSQTALNEGSFHQVQQSQSMNGSNRVDVLRNTGGRSESYTIDAPSEVVDDL